MISVNERAAAIVHAMIADAAALGLETKRLQNGTTLVDAGVNVPGGLEAGRLFAQACMGGLGEVSFTHQSFKGSRAGADPEFWLPAVSVSVTNPPLGCMASQYAGWAVKHGSYFAIGSGPARALYADEEIFGKLDYQDRSETAVLMLEARTLPNADVSSCIAAKCGISPEQLILLIAPTASLAGSVQVAARSAETGMHKLAELGFDIRRVISAYGLCPLAPVAADDLHAIGRTNDAILYGSQVFFAVETDDAELAALIERVPSAGSKDYGEPFYDLLMRHNGDFYQIDRLLFSPARIEINNLKSGRTFRAGCLNSGLIEASLLEH